MEQTYLPQGTSGDMIPLAIGNPALEALPWEALQQAAEKALTFPRAYQALQYGAEQGVPELIAYLTNRVSQVEAINVRPQNLMLTTGATGAVEMIARLFAHRTGVVLVEAPTYRDVLQVFRDQHLRLISIGMDENGPLIEPLRALLEARRNAGTLPSIFYTIPNFQNPTGVTASLERRQAIIQLCQAFGVLILEDDVYHDLIFDGQTPPSYYALAGGKAVVRVSSFSKTLAPGLRLGWIIAPEAVIEACLNSGNLLMGGGANPLIAALVADYCQEGLWEPHIEHLCDLYRRRRDIMLAALATHMPPTVSWTLPGGGFFIWLTLPEPVNGQVLDTRAKAAGVLIAPGHTFFPEADPQTRHIRLSFSYASPDAIATGIASLAAILKAMLILST